MDHGDLYRVGSSFGRGNYLWRSDTVSFEGSGRGEDEEEALKWAALERLPTYDRLRKGILHTPSHRAQEVDVGQLGLQERQELLNRLVKTPEEDNQRFLSRLKERLDRVGIELPTVEVRFEHLTVEAEAQAGRRATPTFLTYPINLIEDVLGNFLPNRKKHLTILKDISGIIKPGRLTLLLGPPSSGKTTLLLALAGKPDRKLKVSGLVTYNGHTTDEFVPERTAAYISQHDLHIGEMTVRETLSFSSRCQGVGSRFDLLTELLRREKAAGIHPDSDVDVFMKAAATEGQETTVITDYVLKVLGLDICADTLVGNDMIRGISGGQKKRVTTGEMLVGPVKVFFMDEISTGLDSSTTFQIVNTLKQNIHTTGGTAVISLLQPAPETYDLFDDIIFISDCQIVYQGPREEVLDFFEQVGFRCPERKGVADFLQEVTSRKDQEQYWARKDVPYTFVRTEEFVETFASFRTGKRLQDELSVPFDKSKSHPAALTKTKYGVGKRELSKACIARELLLMKRNAFIYVFKILQLVVMGTLTMTLFLRTKMHRDTVSDGGLYSGAIFFGVIMIMFNGMAETSLIMAKLPVFFKQRDLKFYPAWAYALPAVIKIPISFVEVGVWVFMTYYVIGFDPDPGRLFRNYLAMVVINQMAYALFRAITAICREQIVTNTLGSIVMLLLMALGGFVLSKDQIKKWWIWAFWSSPLMYAQNVIVNNEFLGKSWSHPGPNSTIPLGIQVLKSRSFFTDPSFYWIGVGALLGFAVLFNFIYTLALTFLNPFSKHQAVLTKEPEGSQSGKPGGAIQLTSQSSSISQMSPETGAQRNKKGMVLPFQPYSLTFDEIVYSVDMPQEMKAKGVDEDKLVLLKNVSGAFRPGVLTALMGVSGAGKTTLMDVLAGRKTGGYIEGNITISGYPKKQETFARISGYCEQFDIHSPHVTVYESLVFSAWLRLPPEVDDQTRKSFIEEVMELVELNPLRNLLVGLPGISGLSTEQRKRLTIAVELVANPSIIFMDEPTSGLDARAAAIVMRTVRNTVDTGRTVVCTIHQPSIDIFEAFDELFLLKRGGQEIYVGPLGRRSCHLVEYFEAIEGVAKIKDGYNPATWMLEITSVAQEQALGVDFAEVYKNSELHQRNKTLIQELSKPAPDSKDLHFDSQYAQTLYTQCVACLWKQHRSYWCNPIYTSVRFLFTTFIAFIFGTIFWNIGSKIEKAQQLNNAMGSMYASVLFLGVQNSSGVQPVVAVERTVFYRERAAGMYSAMPYAFGQAVVELPYILLQAVVYGLIVYSMLGYPWDAAKFFWYLFFMFFTFSYYTFYGMMAVAMTPNMQVAAITAAGFYGLWNLFSGFMIPRPHTPVWWRWFSYINPVAWTLYGLVVSQFGDLKNKLESGQTVEHYVRSYFGFKHEFLGGVAVIVAGFAVLFGFIFGFCIKKFNFQRR